MAQVKALDFNLGQLMVMFCLLEKPTEVLQNKYTKQFGGILKDFLSMIWQAFFGD